MPEVPVPGVAWVKGLSVLKRVRSLSRIASRVFRYAGSRCPMTGDSNAW
jgi:hypothetical protein